MNCTPQPLVLTVWTSVRHAIWGGIREDRVLLEAASHWGLTSEGSLVSSSSLPLPVANV